MRRSRATNSHNTVNYSQAAQKVADAKKRDDGVHTSTPRSASEADAALSAVS